MIRVTDLCHLYRLRFSFRSIENALGNGLKSKMRFVLNESSGPACQ